MVRAIKKCYLSFLEKNKKNFFEEIFCLFLCFFSFLYGGAVALRNFLYAKGVIKQFSFPKPVISIGSISWSGAGKTTVAFYLHERLSPEFNAAILRRGYGTDEEKIFKARGIKALSSPDRVNLLKEFFSSFDLFILDDGFQYRKLKRDLDIVVMGAREFKKSFRLIPADFFREPLSSLKRADLLIVNYKSEISDSLAVRMMIREKFPRLNVYFADYKFKKILDRENREIALASLKGRKLAAFAAIGYPQGFFNKLKELNLDIYKEITYPDHYSLNPKEFNRLKRNILSEGGCGLIVTRKDKYHLPYGDDELDIFIMEIDIAIEEENSFLEEVTSKLSAKR